jgi:hypothetical protein
MNLLAIVPRLMNAALGRLTKKTTQLLAERAAGREPDIVATDHAETLLDDALDRLGGGGLDGPWWARVAVEGQAALVRPEEFRKPFVREWLASPEVRRSLKAQARAQLAGNPPDAAQYEASIQECMQGLLEDRQHAEPILRIAVAFLRASVQSASGDAGTAGLVQLTSREQQRRFDAVDQRLSALASHHHRPTVADRARSAAMMLADLSVPRRHWDPVTSPPAALLRAEFCVVPFTGRTRELGDIAGWVNNEANIALGLISGPGGRGKTRLAMEAAIQVAANGWSSGFVSPKTLTLLLEALPAGGHLLAVVDYAEDDPASLIGALAAANQQAAAKPCTIRILLLARNAGEWFQRLQECGGPVADLIHHPSTFFRLRLAQLAGTEDDSTALMRLARDAFRGALTLPSPAHSSSPVTTARDALIIFSHALLIELGDETSHADEKAVLEYLLARERGFWHRALSHQNLAEAHWRLFETLVAVVAYAGGAGNLSQTDKLFRTFATNFSIDLATTEAFRLVLTAVYGLGAGIEPLQPDRLGEHLMAHHANPEVIALASFRAAV